MFGAAAERPARCRGDVHRGADFDFCSAVSDAAARATLASTDAAAAALGFATARLAATHRGAPTGRSAATASAAGPDDDYDDDCDRARAVAAAGSFLRLA